jgi:hypothetical protein
MNSYCPDPRPLSPRDPEPADPPIRVWHFLSEDLEHEHWVEDPAEVGPLLLAYDELGIAYNMTSYVEVSH